MTTLPYRMVATAVAACALITSAAQAQAVNDSCASPTVLSGPGPHNYDTSAASTGIEGQSEPLCSSGGTTTIASDLWFTVTAPFSGNMLVSLCGLAGGADTKIAAYAGSGCPSAPALACNDDACGLESQLCFPVFAGGSYTLQIGMSPSGVPGAGSLTLTQTSCCTGPTGAIAAGSDLLYTPDGGCSFHDFGGTPLMANFFGVGSQPFSGNIFFKGAALNGTGIPPGTDTIIERLAPANLGACPSTATVPIVMRALSLQSAVDINILFPTSTFATYRVEACLSSVVAQTPGFMTIQRNYQGGGTFTSSLPVVAKFTFTLTGGTASGAVGSAVLDQGSFGLSVNLSAPGVGTPPTSWVYTAPAPASPGGTVDHDCDSSSAQIAFPPSTNFFVGFVDPGATCSTPPTCYPIKEISREDALYARHCFLPVYIAPIEGPYCMCQGNHTPQPCNNSGGLGRGCENSFGTGGGFLQVSGVSQVSSDTITLMVSGLTGGTCLFFQGNGAVESPFGDGLRCAGGSVARLGVKIIAAGVSAYPGIGDLPVSVKGSVPLSGGQRFYQVWYRNSAAFCTTALFNLSNGYQLVWQP